METVLFEAVFLGVFKTFVFSPLIPAVYKYSSFDAHIGFEEIDSVHFACDFFFSLFVFLVLAGENDHQCLRVYI